MDNTALYKIGYGLYILTANYQGQDNGCIVNTVLQVTSSPSLSGVVTVNKQNYTHDMIVNSKEFNLSILTTETPFEVFKHFGFQSGKTVEKFAGYEGVSRSENGIIFLPKYSNAYLSFHVTELIDFGSHTMFRADITDGVVISKAESVTYAYYQQFIKERPKTVPSIGYRCSVCGYIYENESLPDDFICPTCKHGASDFEKL